MRECCRQVEAEVLSNSRNKIHQTWGLPYSGALYTLLSICGVLLFSAACPSQKRLAFPPLLTHTYTRRAYKWNVDHSACLLSFPLNPLQNKQGPPLHPHVPRSGGGGTGGKAPTSRQAGGGKGKGKKGKKGKKDQYDLIVNIDLVRIL